MDFQGDGFRYVCIFGALLGLSAGTVHTSVAEALQFYTVLRESGRRILKRTWLSLFGACTVIGAGVGWRRHPA